MRTHDDLHGDIKRLEGKLDLLVQKVTKLDIDLAVHKIKTGRWSVLLGALTSAAVAVGALLLKGCV